MKKKINLNQNAKQTYLSNKRLQEILMNNYYEKLMNDVDNSDVDINHLENIFTNETYHSAMKCVPAIERQVLYLSYIKNYRLNEICKILKLQKNEVISLRSKAIVHFKNNVQLLYKYKKIKGDKK